MAEINVQQIYQALQGAGHTYVVGVADSDGTLAGVRLDFAAGTTQQQMDAAYAFLATLDLRPRRNRTVYAILQDVTALSAAQLAAVWNDLMAGTPPRLALDAGPNAAAVFVMHFLGTAVGGLTAAEKNEGRRRAVAFYVQDNPKYLVGPPFDATINVPGDEPIG